MCAAQNVLFNRREFLGYSATAGVGLLASPAKAQRARSNAPRIIVETDEFILWSGRYGRFMNNTYLVVDRATGSSAVVDPFLGWVEQWRPIVNELSRPVDTVLITHAHIDHVCGIAGLHSEYPDAKVHAHEEGVRLITAEDVPTLTGGVETLAEYAERFKQPLYQPAKITDYLREGEDFFVGKTRFEVLVTPGHCPGHVAFLNGHVLISGDVLYKGSVGFTNIPGSDPKVLADTIISKFLPLGDDVWVYPGHAATTTIGDERKANKFILKALGEAQ
jgi:glyoxylase-like metal-dependent hydrolase (beta-lactamase superfamily II)